MEKPTLLSRRLRNHWSSLLGWIWFVGCFAVLLFLLCRHANGWFHSDHACDLILSKLLATNGGILSSDWIYSTELMVFNSQLVYIPLFWLTNNWQLVHLAGIAIMLTMVVASCWYFCRESSLRWFFPFYAAVHPATILTICCWVPTIRCIP